MMCLKILFYLGNPFNESDMKRNSFLLAIFGAETAFFKHFCAVLNTNKRHTPLDIGLLSHKICTDLRGSRILGKPIKSQGSAWPRTK